MGLTAWCSAGLGPPGGNCLLCEPDGEASALAQGRVILRPIRHPVPLLGDVVPESGIGFEWHGRYPTERAQAPYVTQCQLPTRLSVQQSPIERHLQETATKRVANRVTIGRRG